MLTSYVQVVNHVLGTDGTDAIIAEADREIVCFPQSDKHITITSRQFGMDENVALHTSIWRLCTQWTVCERLTILNQANNTLVLEQ